MLTIFILYSPDRLNELVHTIYSLQEMDGYKDCQKILCVDGQTNTWPSDFEIIEVNRPESGFYCWAKMWDVAVDQAIHDNILYLDSDRILPKSFLTQVLDNIEDNAFLFPDTLYKMAKTVGYKEISVIRELRHISNSFGWLDNRVYSNPWDAIARKNPMSGCVAFTKSTFKQSGGLDYSFQGWGYPDTDYFASTYNLGCKFIPLECTEYHLYHAYGEDHYYVSLMGLWNGLKFCRKWGYDIHPFFLKRLKEARITIEAAEECKSVGEFLDFIKSKKLLM